LIKVTEVLLEVLELDQAIEVDSKEKEEAKVEIEVAPVAVSKVNLEVDSILIKVTKKAVINNKD
jgi:hypothetical protein